MKKGPGGPRKQLTHSMSRVAQLSLHWGEAGDQVCRDCGGRGTLALMKMPACACGDGRKTVHWGRWPKGHGQSMDLNYGLVTLG